MLDTWLRAGRSRASMLALIAIAAVSFIADARLGAAVLWIAILALVVAKRWPRSSPIAPTRTPARRRLAPSSVVLVAVLLCDLGPWALLHLPRGDTAAFYPVTPAIETLRREAAVPGGPWRTSGEMEVTSPFHVWPSTRISAAVPALTSSA